MQLHTYMLIVQVQHLYRQQKKITTCIKIFCCPKYQLLKKKILARAEKKMLENKKYTTKKQIFMSVSLLLLYTSSYKKNYYVNKKIEQFSYVFNSISPLMFGECQQKKKSHTPTTTLTNILKGPPPYSQKIMIVLFVLNIEKKDI